MSRRKEINKKKRKEFGRSKMPEGHIWVYGIGPNMDDKIDYYFAAQCGAEDSAYEGLSGQTYAIRVEDRFAKPLAISELKKGVDDFIHFAKRNPQWVYEVDAIGCDGISAYFKEPHKLIAPLFREALEYDFIELPGLFTQELT